MAASVSATLADDLAALEPALARVLRAVASAVAGCAAALRSDDACHEGGVGTSNAFGDTQIQADILTNERFFAELRGCDDVASAASEEASEPVQLSPRGTYSVAFDPLDGSSVLDANFAVGTIVGVWPGAALVGRTGREQVAACYSVYGPRTLLVLAAAGLPGGVNEYALRGGDGDGDAVRWRRSRTALRVAPDSAKVFAPANARAAADNAPYRDLLHRLLDARLTIRYSGAMVPDVHHILAKGGGVFLAPGSAVAPPKLRLLFEAAPMAFVVEAAGGASSDGDGKRSLLDQRVEHPEQRTAVCLGSPAQVAQCADAMRGGQDA